MADRRGRHSLGGRLGRYARVGASVGGLAARLAGERYLGWSARSRQARRRPEGGAGRAQGPADEGGAAARHHPRRAAAGICAASWPSCRPTRRPWAGPSCAGAWRPSWGRTGRSKFAAASTRRPRSPPRSARSIARRCRTAREVAGQAAVSRHGLGARGRPRPAQAGVRDRPALRSGDPHRRDPCRDHDAPARGARLPARGQARRALPPHAARRARRARARGRAGALDRPAADHDLARRASRCSTGRAARRRSKRRAGRQHVPRLVRAVLFLRRDPRRPASRQLHGAARRRGEPDGLRLRPHLPAALRARLDRALSRADDRRPRPRRGGLRGLGLYRPDAAR